MTTRAAKMETDEGAEANYARARRLLQFAQPTLASALATQWAAATGSVWVDGMPTGAELERRIAAAGGAPLFKAQTEVVRAGVLSTFDITLLVRATKAVGPLSPAQRDAVDCVRDIRNDLSHLSRDALADAELDELFDRIGSALCVLGACPADIARIRVAPLHEDTAELMQTDANAEQEARTFKEEGNRRFRARDYRAAVDLYTKAASISGAVPPRLLAELYCNRSHAHAKLGERDKAMKDAEFALQLEPRWWRVHQRHGDALEAQDRFDDAAKSYERAVAFAATSFDAGPAVQAELEQAMNDVRAKDVARSRHEELNTAYAPQGMSTGKYADAMRARAGVNGVPVLLQTIDKHPVMGLMNAMNLDDGNDDSPEGRWFQGYRHVLRGQHALAIGKADEALREFGIAANAYSHPDGMYHLALLLSSGMGTARDDARAEMWARKAVAQPAPTFLLSKQMAMDKRGFMVGVGAAWNMLGDFHANGLGSCIKDERAARDCFEESAKLHHMAGLNNLGIYYLTGRGGLPVDRNQAHDLFMHAAELGANDAMTGLGDMAMREKNWALALTWYKAAVAHGALYAADRLEEAEWLLQAELDDPQRQRPEAGGPPKFLPSEGASLKKEEPRHDRSEPAGPISNQKATLVESLEKGEPQPQRIETAGSAIEQGAMLAKPLKKKEPQPQRIETADSAIEQRATLVPYLEKNEPQRHRPGPQGFLSTEQKAALAERLESFQKQTSVEPAVFRRDMGPKPTHAELAKLQPRTPYVERLTEARARLEDAGRILARSVSHARFLDGAPTGSEIAAMEAAVRLAASAIRMPDAQMIYSRRDTATLVRVAEFLWKRKPTVDTATVLSTSPPNPTTTSAVAWLRMLWKTFPSESYLSYALGSLLMFPGPDEDFDEGIRLLGLALAHTVGPDDGPEKVLLRYSLGAHLMRSDRSFQQSEGVQQMRKYLARAAHSGERMVGQAHFLLGIHEETNHRQGGIAPHDTTESIQTRVRAHYDAGISAIHALPPFLQETELNRNAVRVCRALAYPELMAPELLPSVESVAGRFGGSVLLPVGERGWPLRPLKRDVSRRLHHLRELHVDQINYAAQKDPTEHEIVQTTNTPRASRWHGDAEADRQLAPRSLEELVAAREDRVYDGAVLSVVIVSMPARISAMMVLVEDAHRDCIRLAVYGVAPDTQNQLWIPGRTVRLRNPYVRLAADDTTILRVDHPSETVALAPTVIRLCWNCLRIEDETARMLACAKCGVALYCGRACQAADWKSNAHKVSCRVLAKK